MQKTLCQRLAVTFAVFSFLLVLEHGEIGSIATLGNQLVVNGCQHGATWLVGVGAVAEAAVSTILKYLTEIVAHLLGLEIEGAESADAGGVDDVGVGR